MSGNDDTTSTEKWNGKLRNKMFDGNYDEDGAIVPKDMNNDE